MKKTVLGLVALTISIGVSAQDVNIPDANFKTYLVGNTALNTNADAEIQVSEAAAFTGNLFCNNLGIADLTGIEAFTSVTGIYIRDNSSLGSIDISANVALDYIDCQNAGLNSLDISNNVALTGINCMINNLSSLDVSNNPDLGAIACSNNNLTSLDVSNNPLLSNFSCDNNDLTSIDVTNNPGLIYFVCHFNDLTSVDLSNCTSLSWFSCSGNDISDLDLSNNIALGNLYCAQNNLTILDLGINTTLQFINCTDNDLSILNIANGNNVNFSGFNTAGNPNLACIQVDDETWSTTNWTSIDATSSFSTDCNYGLGLTETDVNQNLSIFPNPCYTELQLELEEKIITTQIVDAMGRTFQANLAANNSIDVSVLSQGVYILQVETEKGMITKKFIKK